MINELKINGVSDLITGKNGEIIAERVAALLIEMEMDFAVRIGKLSERNHKLKEQVESMERHIHVNEKGEISNFKYYDCKCASKTQSFNDHQSTLDPVTSGVNTVNGKPSK